MQGFCPLKTEIARFCNGFRLKMHQSRGEFRYVSDYSTRLKTLHKIQKKMFALGNSQRFENLQICY